MLPQINPGDKFKCWTVIERVDNYKRDRAYLCECKCGCRRVITSHRLRSEDCPKSCRRCSYTDNIKHGDSRSNNRTPIYVAWDNMLRRCENPKHPGYSRYGGRGIRVCDAWHSYEAFRDWCLSNGWRKGLSLDRIDNDGNYEPDNCRWTTQRIQVHNSTTTKHITIDGVTKSIGEWLKSYNVSYWFVSSRMKKFNIGFEDAIKMPRLRRKINA